MKTILLSIDKLKIYGVKIKSNSFSNPLIAAWLVMAVLIFVAFYFLFPSKITTISFWCRFTWGEYLNIIFWYGAGEMFNIKESSKSIMTPSLSILISTVCLISFAFMIIDYKYIHDPLWHQYHITLQVLTFIIGGLVLIGINIAGEYKENGYSGISDMGKSPQFLSNSLLEIERYLFKISYQDESSLLVKNIKILRSKIENSAFDSIEFRRKSEYKEFDKNICILCDSLKDIIILRSDVSKEKLFACSVLLNRLINEIDDLSAEMNSSSSWWAR